MSTLSSRIAAAAAVLGLVSTGVFGSLYVSDHDEARWVGVVPPAQDALTQSLDLDRIAGFRYVGDGHVQVTDELGHRFAMDRSTAVGVAGHICTFKDFALVK